ncbi:MAG TPA: MerR family transcriptional regulator [Thermomicrobiales bacterium]|nr:MerR family transcriptional regulator [Thermomicrobiales bacterium]HRA47035.1 MerR family transcriptional regulator [Thermomicrobiales bacterium]
MSNHFNEPLFVISVAARLVQMHPQTLRKYEREGLIAPSRTQGNLRLYSDRDIERLRQVKYLVEDLGLNLAGVQMVLEVTRRLRDMRRFTMDRVDQAGDTAGSDTFLALSGEIATMLRTLGYIDEDEAQVPRHRDLNRPDSVRS